MSVTTLAVTEAKQRFTELVKNADKYFDRFLVTKNGKEAAVVMSAAEYESLLETIDILANRNEVRAIALGARQARTGQTTSLQEYLKQKKVPRSPNGK